jgi:hypothetical protein
MKLYRHPLLDAEKEKFVLGLWTKAGTGEQNALVVNQGNDSNVEMANKD